LNTNLEVTVTSNKVITIPAGVVVAFKSLTTKEPASVTVIGPQPYIAQNVLASFAEGAGGSAGVILIKTAFNIEVESSFNLKGNAKLAFYQAVTEESAVVDGSLTAEIDGSIFWVAGTVDVLGGAAEHKFGGEGSVQTSEGTDPVAVAEAVIAEREDDTLLEIPIVAGGGEDEEDEEEADPFDDENYVNVPVNSVTVNYAESGQAVAEGGLSLPKEQTVQLKAVTDPEGIAVTWFSGKKSVATVEDGLVTAVKAGQAQIMAKAGGVSAIIDVTVTADKAAGLYVGTEIAESDPKEYTYDDEIDISGRNEATTLAKAFGYIKDKGSNGGVYLILLDANETDVAGYSIGTGPTGSSTGTKTNLKITLQGMDGKTVEIQKNSTAGALFTVYGSAATDKPELVLGQNITLKGIDSNTSALVVVGNTANTKVGTLTMLEGSRITGNTNTTGTGGGVFLDKGGVFDMQGGKIYNNIVTRASSTVLGGGVATDSGTTVTMSGGNIENNTAGSSTTNTSTYGGGIAVNGTFNMTGGSINNNQCLSSGNTAHGGGVDAFGTFTMSGGAVIKNNSAKSGGGVFVDFSTASFTMSGGSIEGNTATTKGAAVYKDNKSSSFIKNGGAIYGTNAGSQSNKGVENSNNVHAIDIIDSNGTNRYRDATAEENDSLTSASATGWGQ
jgi:hypothetical protein